ncbi:hypothetical protein [Cognatiyoonia sp. IB215182]|uniref:hypothetical protein n=1 Tax=Cognatiyoonia sp. IB215182 TaxID=3097353 RepID=UPI002A0CACCC|nr:hypothetical protein [Cognatiyoonia sp. IB215182]MDX8355380.1 hypothetical protein [Cognatiyoonia sp. IB215182]
MKRRKPPIWFLLLFVAFIAILVIKILPPQTRFTINWTSSAPLGLYVRTSREKATYVSFCLRQDHAVFFFFDQVCHPAAPENTALLKRIRKRLANGSLEVAGRGAFAIDSDLIGRVEPSQIQGWWRPFITWET